MSSPSLFVSSVPSVTPNVFVAVFNANPVLFIGIKPSAVVEVGGAEVERAECKGKSVMVVLDIEVLFSGMKPSAVVEMGGVERAERKGDIEVVLFAGMKPFAVVEVGGAETEPKVVVLDK